MPGILLQQTIMYGPVLSRRLGRSMGINLLPTNRKVCSFDCVYCQYGRTESCTIRADRIGLPTIDDVLDAVEKALKKPRTIETLTFSGNGEASIHPDFPEIVAAVKEIRDEIRPEVKLAILSNSSQVLVPDIINALSLIDLPIMKLDAGDEGTFRKINKPAAGLRLSDILRGLQSVPNLMIQSMLIDGELSNIRGAAYENWTEALIELHPQKILIYSTERPTAQGNIKRVSPMKLSRIESDLRSRYHLNVEAYWRE